MRTCAPGAELRLLVVGLSHKTAPVRVREKAALGRTTARALVRALMRSGAVAEAVVLSTCNRTELYLATEQWDEALSSAQAALLDAASISIDELRCARYVLLDEPAVEHLFAVVAGLDAMIVGETEIVAQTRAAVEVAMQEHGVGAVLEPLFRRAFVAGRRVRAQTRISQGAVSVSSVAVELAHDAFRTLAGRSALILGAGEVARGSAQGLSARGMDTLVIANRTIAGARALAREVGGRAVSLDAIDRELKLADVVVGATEAPQIVLSAAAIANACSGRARPMLLIDLAVPRDIEPTAAKLGSVTLYDIDDLQQAADANLNGRREQVPAATEIVRTEARRFQAWRGELAVAPTLRALRLRVEAIRRATLESVIRDNHTLANAELERLDRFSRILVNRLLREPTTRLRKASPTTAAQQHAEALSDLFALSESAASADSGALAGSGSERHALGSHHDLGAGRVAPNRLGPKRAAARLTTR
jgi:glutamyl-tRNA reductase